MSSERNIPNTINLLNIIYKNIIPNPIVHITILKKDNTKINIDSKDTIMDFHCIDNIGREYIIEMQKVPDSYIYCNVVQYMHVVHIVVRCIENKILQQN